MGPMKDVFENSNSTRTGGETRNIAVIGGAGYIGSYTAHALSCAGFKPVIVDDLSKGYRSFVPNYPLDRKSVGRERV